MAGNGNQKNQKYIRVAAEKFYATVYLIARTEHHCQMMGVAGAEQR